MKKKNNAGKILVIVTVVFAALLVLLAVLTQKNNDSANTFEKPSIEGQPQLGNQKATVTITEFGDYLCPSCKVWSQNIFPRLQQDYIDTGKVNFAFINTLFHGAGSQLTALAAESIFKKDPDNFWEFHEALYEAQPEEEHDTTWATNELMIQLAQAEAPSVDPIQLEADLKSQAAQAELDRDNVLVTKYNVQFTPSIMINGKMMEKPFDYDELTKLIEAALEEAK